MGYNENDASEQPGDDTGATQQTDGSLPPQKDGQELKSLESESSVNQSVSARETWSHGAEFILSCIGFAVGLGNVWRFPYLCYKNGGGAFLIPYFICLIAGGVPMFFLEIAVGQFMSEGGLGVWKICPIFQGIGVATTVIVFLLNCYYIIILAWDVFYLYESFTSVLPWSHCNNTWNTERCTLSFIKDASLNCSNATVTALYAAECNATANNITRVDPVVEFWEYRILQISDGVDEVGTIVWQLALALAIVWIVCYFCIWKGVRWTGKVVYFTATFPYVVITILFIRGVTLEGAGEGIKFYLLPQFEKLLEAQVWIDAGTQIFFSYAIALGAMTALGSYNKFHNNVYKDCIIIACVNSGTSLYAGFVIFSVLGFMAHEQGVSIDKVAESGPGLAFIAYPKAVTQMPLSPLWAILFFLMVVFLGLDSQFVGVEAFITAMLDLFPNFLRKRHNREIFTAVYCLISYLIGLTMVTNGGMYVFQLFDYYSASGSALLWVCFFECAAVAWVYGGARFYDNIEMMIGYRINPWFRICWTVLTPLITAAIFIFSWVKFEPLKYNKTYVYPAYAQGLGMCMAFASMICIPLYVVYAFIRTPGNFMQRLKYLITPRLNPHQQVQKYSNGMIANGCNGNECHYISVPITAEKRQLSFEYVTGL